MLIEWCASLQLLLKMYSRSWSLPEAVEEWTKCMVEGWRCMYVSRRKEMGRREGLRKNAHRKKAGWMEEAGWTEGAGEYCGGWWLYQIPWKWWWNFTLADWVSSKAIVHPPKMYWPTRHQRPIISNDNSCSYCHRVFPSLRRDSLSLLLRCSLARVEEDVLRCLRFAAATAIDLVVLCIEKLFLILSMPLERRWSNKELVCEKVGGRFRREVMWTRFFHAPCAKPSSAKIPHDRRY